MSGSRIITACIILLIISAAVVFFWQTKSGGNEQSTTPISNKSTDNIATDRPAIISTKPDPLEGAIITASEVIEIAFSHPLENEGEFKLRIEPAVEFKIQLSSDRKTAKIIPQKPYELGRTYSLFIKGDTKFDGVGQWGEEKIFHVNTVRYRGI